MPISCLPPPTGNHHCPDSQVSRVGKEEIWLLSTSAMEKERLVSQKAKVIVRSQMKPEGTQKSIKRKE